MTELSNSRLNASTSKRYYTSMKVLWPRAAMIIGVLVFVPVIMALSGEEVDGLMIGLFAVIIVLCLVVFFGASRMAWMTMDADGLVYKGLGFKLATSWDNIDSIGKKSMMNEGTVEGLVLIESGLDVHGAIKAGALISWRATIALRDFEYFIPLSNFQTKAWRETEFGRELRRYVPRIFQGESWG